MTLNLSLSAPTEARLKKRAAAVGKDPADYARSLIESGMLAEQSFDDILRPAREGFRRRGTTPKQLGQAVARAREAFHRSKPARGRRK